MDPKSPKAPFVVPAADKSKKRAAEEEPEASKLDDKKVIYIFLK